MSLARIKPLLEDSRMSIRRTAWGNLLIRFCPFGLMLSSLIKFSRLPGPAAYMASLGYMGATYFLIAGLEFMLAMVFWRRSRRPFGLLVVSSHLDGAISAHIASGHPSLSRSPFMASSLSLPLPGMVPACVFLASAWIGAWLVYPAVMANRDEPSGDVRKSRQQHPRTTIVLRRERRCLVVHPNSRYIRGLHREHFWLVLARWAGL